MTTDKQEFINNCLNRLIEHARYTGCDAEDWTPEADGATIRNALQTQAELVDKAKALYDALEKTNWSSWQTTASFSKQQEDLGKALARAEGKE